MNRYSNSNESQNHLRVNSLNTSSHTSTPALNRLPDFREFSKRKNVRFSEKLESRRFFKSAEWYEEVRISNTSHASRFLPILNFLRKKPQISVASFKESCVGCLPWHRSADYIDKGASTRAFHLQYTDKLNDKSSGFLKRFLNEKCRKQEYASFYLHHYIESLAAKHKSSSLSSDALDQALSLTASQMESVYIPELDLTDDEGYGESCSDWEGYEIPSNVIKDDRSSDFAIYEPVRSLTSCQNHYCITTSSDEYLYGREFLQPVATKFETQFRLLQKARPLKVSLQDISDEEGCITTNKSYLVQEPVISREKQVALSLSRLTLPTWAVERFGVQNTQRETYDQFKQIPPKLVKTKQRNKSQTFLPRFPRYLRVSSDEISKSNIDVKTISFTQL